MPAQIDIDRIVDACVDVATIMKRLRLHSFQLESKTDAVEIEWTGEDQAQVDARLVERGLGFTSADVKNFLASLLEYDHLWDNQAVTQGDHKKVVEQLTNPIV